MNHRKGSTFYGAVRDEVNALAEKFYLYYRAQYFDRISKANKIIRGDVVHHHMKKTSGVTYAYANQHAQTTMAAVNKELRDMAHDLILITTRMKQRCYAMGALGEFYALSTLGLSGDKKAPGLNDPIESKHKVAHYADRIILTAARISREINTLLEQGLIYNTELQVVLAKIDSVFGLLGKEKVREAEADGDVDSEDIGILDDNDIAALSSELRAVNKWTNRQPKVWTRSGSRGWEFERDLKTELVHAVRTGKIDAAERVGYDIDDYTWITLTDGDTCECCCRPRDGLTLSEIEKKFGDDTPPPLHFNCRCDLAPASKQLDEMWDDAAEKSGVQLEAEGFEEWLKKQGL